MARILSRRRWTLAVEERFVVMVVASNLRQRELLNLLRYLGNELCIPFVRLRTRQAYLAIRSDDHLENRFEPFLLPVWEDGPKFGRPLASFEAVLPLRELFGLGLPAMRVMVLQRSAGTIGEVAALVTAATETALLSGQERIDVITVEAAEYQPPTVVGACSRENCNEQHSYRCRT